MSLCILRVARMLPALSFAYVHCFEQAFSPSQEVHCPAWLSMWLPLTHRFALAWRSTAVGSRVPT